MKKSGLKVMQQARRIAAKMGDRRAEWLISAAISDYLDIKSVRDRRYAKKFAIPNKE
jgi:hypothetical protein